MNKLSVLIAEDEVLTRLDVKEILEEAGHTVCGETNNGLEAVELAKQLHPDLALIDIMIPGLQGLEVAKMLQVLNIPVLVMTAYSQPQYINRAEKVAVFGYLIKPIRERDLLPAIQIAYGRWKEINDVRIKLKNANHKLKHQKIIAHARTLLASHNDMTEYDAHQQLLKEAMDQRVPLITIASAVIDDLSPKRLSGLGI